MDIHKNSRLYKSKGKFFLRAFGYREYEKFLKKVDINKSPWTKLHNLEGNIEERLKKNYSVFCLKPKDPEKHDKYGLQMILSDIDLDKTADHQLIKISDWRVKKAYAQRIYYLSLCNCLERLKRLESLESQKERPIKPLFFEPIDNTVISDKPLSYGKHKLNSEQIIKKNKSVTFDYKDFGYETRYSLFKSSRNILVTDGIYVHIGKYFRSILCLAPMPDSTGSIDVVVTGAFCHMLSVIPRNSEFKDTTRQVAFAKSVLIEIDNSELLDLPKKYRAMAKKYARRNVCAAIGVNDLNRFKKLYEVGIRSFRLYSVATDARIKESFHSLILEIDKIDTKGEVELFVGQITTVAQFEDLYDSISKKAWSRISGFYIGNGGGSKCKTAETGMRVTSPQLSYQLRNNKRLGNKSLIVEGGVGNEPAAALLLGASGLSYSAGITGGCIESPGGALFILDGKGYWKPYRGEASPSTKIIEENSYPTGDARQVEGANGFIRMEKKYPSMCGRILNLTEWISQCFVKLGVTNIEQLHALGAELTKSEMENIFKMSVKKIPDVYKLKNGKYYIPFPLGLRSEAQRNIAKAYGTGQKIRENETADIDYTVRIN